MESSRLVTCAMAGLLLGICLGIAPAAADTIKDAGLLLNSGGVSSGIDPDGIRRSTNYAIVDSIGQFVVSTSNSLEYRVEHGYWSSEPDITYLNNLSEAKGYGDGTLVRLSGKIATAGNDHLAIRFYIEEMDRSSGLQVRYGVSGGPLVTAGSEINVAGRLATVNGERALEYPFVSILSSGNPTPEILLMLGRDAGGGSLNDHTPGVWLGSGPHNVGLLISITGRVTYKDPAGTFFYVDDGSGIEDGAGWGIRVICTDLAPGNVIALPSVNKFVTVHGIVSTTHVGSADVRCIRPRSQSDVTIRVPGT